MNSRGEENWHHLLAGNARYVAGQPIRRPSRPGLSEHRPLAAVLTCADARAVPDDVFDVAAGSLFTLRSAGHTVDTSVVGSLQFALERLHVPLIVVLGHTHCGTVRAAHEALAEGHIPEGPLGDVVARVLPGDIEPDADEADIAERHIRACRDQLLERSGPVARAAQSGALRIETAQLRLEDGVVRVLD